MPSSNILGSSFTAASMTISIPNGNRSTSATAAFTQNDVGSRISAPVGSSGASVYGFIVAHESSTSVLVNFTGTTATAAGSVTITGGTVPTSWTDSGVVTPSGSLPGNPVAAGLSVQRWQGQTGDSLGIYDESGDKLFSFDSQARPVASNQSAAPTVAAAPPPRLPPQAAQGLLTLPARCPSPCPPRRPPVRCSPSRSPSRSGSTPNGVHVAAQNAASAALNHYVSSVSTIGFTVSCGTIPGASARCSSASR